MYKLKIGDMAQLGGVSVATLRYYDKKGILTPVYTDAHTGYRYYSVWQVMQLSFLQYLHALGFSAEKIKTLIEMDCVDDIYRIIIQRKEEMDAELNTLLHQRNILSRFLDEYTLFLNHPPYGVPFLQTIPERHLYVYDVDCGFDETRYGLNYEQSIINMMNEMARRAISSNGYINIGSSIKRDDAMQGIAKYRTVYVQVDKRFVGEPGVARKPECICICNICDNPEREQQYIKMLYDECEKRHFEAGDYYREEIVLNPNICNGVRGGIYLQAVPVTLK